MKSVLAALALFLGRQDGSFQGWTAPPGAGVEGGRAVVSGDKWTFLEAPGDFEHLEAQATFTILEPAKRFGYFGESWSVWPDLAYGDGGYEAGILLRAGGESHYRIQFSSKYGELALVKVPEGGFLRVAPCEIPVGKPCSVRVTVQGDSIRVDVNGQEKLAYRDLIRTLEKGRFGLGASSGAKVVFEKATLKRVDPPGPVAAPPPHAPGFTVRKWLGGRDWVFDGREPILLLPCAKSTYVNNVKLRPGFKPLLSWNSHWDVQTQGAFKEADNTFEGLTLETADGLLKANWSFRHVKDRFVVRSTLSVGWNPGREAYTYDVQSELEVLAGEPFHFRYGYDFEHHTPLDPFRWQYLVVRREGGGIVHRPVYPVDPGVMTGVAQTGGTRVWYGRHNGDLLVAPAVEYDLPESGKRKLNTAVCAAFYDTGVGFEPETAPAGTKVRVKYRYTGWPAAEAEALFKVSRIHDSPMLDPEHHYIFADEWPKLTFSQSVPMSRTWIYGRRPFMTGHNQRPTYSLAKETGVGGGFAMRLGPGAYGKASPPAPSPLPAGRWAVAAQVKSENAHGPGGRIEVEFLGKDGKELGRVAHHLGNGTFDWKKAGFGFEIPVGTLSLGVAFGNAGTGDVLLTDVEFAPGAGPAPATAPRIEAAPPGAIADYRMEEGKGRHVFDAAGGPLGMLELANLEWATDSGRPAIRFVENAAGRKDYPRVGNLDRSYMGHPGYVGRQAVPVALAGHHGGGREFKALTIAAWIKPAAKPPKGDRMDVAGLGARRFILGLRGAQAPYRLEARLNVNDAVASGPAIEADRWTFVALSAAEEAGKWRVRLFVDGQPAGEGVSAKFDAPASLPPSLVLGTEIFYFHDACYRGLLGRTLVFDRALDGEALLKLAAAR